MIKSKFGWEPEVSIREGLRRTINWYTNHEAKPKTLEELAKTLESR